MLLPYGRLLHYQTASQGSVCGIVGIGSLYLIIISEFTNNNFDGNLICVDSTNRTLILHVSFVQNKANFYFFIDFNSII